MLVIKIKTGKKKKRSFLKSTWVEDAWKTHLVKTNDACIIMILSKITSEIKQRMGTNNTN